MHLASDPPVTVVLQKIIERNFPSEISRRREEMLMEHPDRVDVMWSDQNMPLFPLKHVAFPGMTFPLHIFEPKYRLMVRRCMAGSRCFGIVNVHMSTNGSCVPFNVGCMVAISKTTTLMDGRSIISCKGLRRFRILQKWDQDGYLVAKVQCFSDEPLKPEEIESYNQNVSTARQMVQEIISNEGRLESLQRLLRQAGDIPSDDLEFSFWMSSLLPISPEHKQELLETTSTAWRFARLLYIVGHVTRMLQGDEGSAQTQASHGPDIRDRQDERADGDGDGLRPADGDGADGTEDMLLETPAAHEQQRRNRGGSKGTPTGVLRPAVVGGGDGVGPMPRGDQQTNERLASDSCSAS